MNGISLCEIQEFVKEKETRCFFFYTRYLLRHHREKNSYSDEKKSKDRKGLLLGMAEGKVNYRYMGEHSQGQGYLVNSREGMTRLSWAMW